MAIYNWYSINEDRSDIRLQDANARHLARAKSKVGHDLKRAGLNYRKVMRDSETKARKGMFASGAQDEISGSSRRAYGDDLKYTAKGKRIADNVNNSLATTQNYTDTNNRYKKKLKEAAQYILDVLDEQEYYDNGYDDYYDDYEYL